MSKEKPEQWNVFIIDDDAFLLDMYALKFSQKNFVVETASGTLLALEKLRGGYIPNIIVVDLVMPAMDGFEFLETIRTEKLASDALVIILSNLGQQEDIDRGLALGAAGYIIKASATPSEVVDKVLSTIEARQKK
jgi:DNA-binding response OmpR family regulator